MTTRRHHHGDDASSPRYRDVAPVSVRPSRETMRSSAPEPPLPTRGVAYTTPQTGSDNAPDRSLSESHIAYEVQGRVAAERGGAERKGSATSFAQSQESMYLKEMEGIKMKDEPRSPREDTPRGLHCSSLKGNFDIHRPPPVHAKDIQPIVPPSASFPHIFEAQSRELSALQHEHRAVLEERRSLTDAYEALKQRYDERSKRLSAARHDRQAALEQIKEIDGAYATLRQQHEEQTKKISAMRHERQATLEQKREIEEEYATLKQKYEAQKNEYSALSNKYHSLKATLEHRTTELQGVQKFLTTADTFSGSEVVNMLRKLNEEVQQSTTFMAEWAVEDFKFELLPADQTARIIEQTRTSETLGMKFMRLLGTRQHKDNPILMEIALRAYLIYELYWVASPWSVGEEEQSHNLYIDAIYQRIREAEGQAVSGNWRALTRAHSLPACISDPEIAHTYDATIVSGFSDVLLAAGCTATKPDITSALWTKFGEKIHHFVSLAGQVNKTIGVGVISEDFEVMVIWPDTAFDERVMEDSYDNGDRAQGTEEREETVLCATELGLMQQIKVGAGTGQKGKPSEFVLIKPKVTLETVTNIIEG